ncbi:MAG: lysophospholipid acyltransferase family protein [Crocinitomicaceae bacterium]|nr:lysophospholipid acyltransferase family protein [Crocinitomicaceae bacterium]
MEFCYIRCMLHAFLKLIVSIGIRLYYRKIRITNRRNLNVEGSCIIVANHPNTLMDAWMIGYACRQPVHYMAKATLFNSPLKLRLLKALKMIPINRSSEKSVKGVSNADSFQACYEVLEKGGTLAIFPEGTSYLERQLRDLKTGAARIALEVEKRGKVNMQIIPVGIDYMRAEKFRSAVYLNVGKPIAVKDFLKADEKSAQSAKQLTEKMRVSLENLLVNLENKEEELLVEKICQIVHSRYSKRPLSKPSPNAMRQIRDRLDEFKLTQNYLLTEIEQLVDQISLQTKQLRIQADFLDRRFRSMMFLRQLLFSIVFLLIGFPFFVFGIVHNLWVYKVIDWLVKKITHEIEYYAPLAVLVSLFLYPLNYAAFLQISNVFGFVYWEKVIYFIAMPVSGLYAFFFVNYWRHIGYKWSYIFSRNKQKEELEELKKRREKLLRMFE